MSDDIKRLQRRVQALETIVEQLIDATDLRGTIDQQRAQADAEAAERGAQARAALSRAGKSAHDAQARRSR